MRLLGYLFLLCLFFIVGFIARGLFDDFCDYRKAHQEQVLSVQAKDWWSGKTKDFK